MHLPLATLLIALLACSAARAQTEETYEADAQQALSGGAHGGGGGAARARQQRAAQLVQEQPQWPQQQQLLQAQQRRREDPHPDAPGLRALAASVCPNSTACGLAAWAGAGSPCGWPGVLCRLVGGSWRAVGVHLQLPAAAVLLRDDALGPDITPLPFLHELELLCTGKHGRGGGSSGPAPPPPANVAAVLRGDGSSGGDAAAAAQAAPAPGGCARCRDDAAAPGELPPRWFAALPSLRYLRVSGCGVRGPLRGGAVAAARQLTSLVLARNALRGPLPLELAQLPGLALLDLSSNAFTGELPPAWSELAELSYLYLQSNNLTIAALPCDWSAGMLSLKLSDLSGNTWLRRTIGGAAPAARCPSDGAPGAAPARRALPPRSSAGGAGVAGGAAARGSALPAPRCWLRRFCAQEGAFICLARHPKRGGSCTAYVYGSSDVHIDGANQCDHGGPHLVAVPALWAGLGLTLLLTWLHHCRQLRRGAGPAAAPQQPQFSHQRQWLLTGPPRDGDAPRGGAKPGGARGRHGAGGDDDATLPLLYHAPSRREDGAGYAMPASPAHAGAAPFRGAAGSPLLPSALETPPPPPDGARYMLVTGSASLAAGGGAPGGGGRGGGGLPATGASRLGGGKAAPPGAGAGAAAAGAGAGGGRLAGRAGQRGAGGDGLGAGALPLALAVADVVTDVRLLLLWGVSPRTAKLWPSTALLALVLAPHLLVGAVTHFRLLAAACLPPALRNAPLAVAGAPAGGVLTGEALPPGSAGIVRLYGCIFGAPATALCAATLPLGALGLAAPGAVSRHLRLLRGAVALSEAPGVSALLTALFLLGNTPLEWAFLDGSLYYVTLATSFADMAVAWARHLADARRAGALAAGGPPPAPWCHPDLAPRSVREARRRRAMAAPYASAAGLIKPPPELGAGAGGGAPGGGLPRVRSAAALAAAATAAPPPGSSRQGSANSSYFDAGSVYDACCNSRDAFLLPDELDEAPFSAGAGAGALAPCGGAPGAAWAGLTPGAAAVARSPLVSASTVAALMEEEGTPSLDLLQLDGPLPGPGSSPFGCPGLMDALHPTHEDPAATLLALCGPGGQPPHGDGGAALFGAAAGDARAQRAGGMVSLTASMAAAAALRRGGAPPPGAIGSSNSSPAHHAGAGAGGGGGGAAAALARAPHPQQLYRLVLLDGSTGAPMDGAAAAADAQRLSAMMGSPVKAPGGAAAAAAAARPRPGAARPSVRPSARPGAAAGGAAGAAGRGGVGVRKSAANAALVAAAVAAVDDTFSGVTRPRPKKASKPAGVRKALAQPAGNSAAAVGAASRRGSEAGETAGASGDAAAAAAAASAPATPAAADSGSGGDSSNDSAHTQLGDSAKAATTLAAATALDAGPALAAKPAQRPFHHKGGGPCDHCGVLESPQWRRGPPAKPILCNACGTRYRRTHNLGPPIPSSGRPGGGRQPASSTASQGGGSGGRKRAAPTAAPAAAAAPMPAAALAPAAAVGAAGGAGGVHTGTRSSSSPATGRRPVLKMARS
ncbi:hypothetical protein HT031_002675 [Scenedesmus sp. PABB004]|nr:hypothetical protein HT031_002675 [Scenedesmus sp. PABB004]